MLFGVSHPRRVVHSKTQDRRRKLWKNGRGITEELALWPPESSFEHDDFTWRISMARVEESGSFSRFPGIDRILVVLDGAGIDLRTGDAGRVSRLRRFEPHGFRGDDETWGELRAGAIVDFSVLTRRTRFRADVEAITLGQRRLRSEIGGTPGAHAVLFVARGSVTVRVTQEEEPYVVGEGELLWAQELPRREEFDLSGKQADSLVLLVRFSPLS
jgi:hypothetical protein